MKNVIYTLVLILLATSAFAISKPSAANALQLLPPSAPGTSTVGECGPPYYEIKDSYCRADIRHYTQCIKTVSGGVWNAKSENCKENGANVVCSFGECRKSEDISKTIFYIVLSVVALIILLIFIKVMRKKR